MQRKPNSVFDQVVKFLNSKPVGTIFTNEELYSQVSEVQSSHKIRYKDYSYTTRFYRYWLMKAGCVEKLGDKKWKVLAHVPDHVSSDMVWGVKGRTPYTLWHISMEENKPRTTNETTLYEITKDNLVLPLVVANTRVAPLLSTGSFFENEYDAAYFLSVGTGVPVEDIIRKSHNFINMKDEVEEQKNEPESEDDNWEFELLEKLHEAIPVNEDESISDAVPFKWIYKIGIENDILYKRRGHIDEIPHITESDDLSSLIKGCAGSKMPWNCLADEMIENFEFDKALYNEIFNDCNNAADSYKRRINLDHNPDKTYQIFPNPNSPFNKVEKPTTLLTLEDIRGKEVFMMYEGKLVKGKVTKFQIICTGDRQPYYDYIGIDKIQGYTFEQKDISFSAEEFKKKLADIVDSL